MRLRATFLVLFLILFATFVDCRRSRGRSRGSSGSSGFWNRKSKSHKSSEPKKPIEQPKPVPQPQPKPVPQPSAPKATEPEIKRENVNLQKSAPQSPVNPANPANSGRPIGWNVDGPASNQNIGFKTGYQPSNFEPHKQHNVNPSYTGAYPQSGAYPNAGYGNSYGSGYPGGYNPQQPYPGYYPTSNIGVIPPRGADAGHYYNSMGGYGQNPMFVNQQRQGMLGGLFGGNKHYGGYPGGYGYPMKKSSSFFGGNAFRNVLAGLFIWHVISGLTSTPYRVYNHYNMPKEERQEFTLPANTLALCNENVTSLCAPGVIPICTQNNTVLCIATMAAATPCQDNNGGLCVNSTVPCLDKNDPLCQNKTSLDNSTTVNLPCFTNVTVDAITTLNNVTLPPSDNNKYCVTAMAVPDPSIPAASTDSTNSTITATNNTQGTLSDSVVTNLTSTST